jgi:hypothetical protein
VHESSSGSRVPNDEDRFFKFHLPVAGKENLIQQKADSIEKLDDRKDQKEPD